MHALSLFESAHAGARFCLEVALNALPCVAGLVHLVDPAARELVVVHAEGPRADALLGTRTPLADPMVFKAMRAAKPLVVTYEEESRATGNACARHAFFDPWSVAVVPVVAAGKLLAVFEMIDPVDGKPFDDLSQAALAYVAERLGRFLVEHGGQVAGDPKPMQS